MITELEIEQFLKGFKLVDLSKYDVTEKPEAKKKRLKEELEVLSSRLETIEFNIDCMIEKQRKVLKRIADIDKEIEEIEVEEKE